MIDKILSDSRYIEKLNKINDIESERYYCKHDLSHSREVVRILTALSESRELNNYEELSAIMGYLHDIGYEFGINENHNVIGGNLLKGSNYKYWQEVYYHGIPNSEYKSLYLDILNTADMMIDKYGNDVGFDKRLENIKKRYGEDSIQYINSFKIINELKGDNYE